MMMKVTNQQVVMVMMVTLVNQNRLNELVLEKIIFALAIESTLIETTATNHLPKQFHFNKNNQDNILTAKLEQ
jgi:hypothetical protein